MNQVWSTKKVAELDRLVYWEESVSDAFLSVRIKYEKRQSFFGEISSQSLGNLRFTQVGSESHTVVRPRVSGDVIDGESIFLNLHTGGSCLMEQGRDSVRMRPGDVAYVEGFRPFQLNFSNANSLVCVELPRIAWPCSAGAMNKQRCHLISRHPTVGPLIRGVILSLASNNVELSKTLQNDLAMNLSNLVGLAISSDCEDSERCRLSYREALYSRLVSAVRSSAFSPDISVQKISSQLGISVRSLHRAFEGKEVTFTEMVLKVRLEKAAELLSSSASSLRKIADIAFFVGFNDVSYFNRRFRECYGVTPREYRESHMSS